MHVQMHRAGPSSQQAATSAGYASITRTDQQQLTSSLTIVGSPSLKGARRGAAKGANTKAATAPAVSSSGAFKGGVCTS